MKDILKHIRTGKSLSESQMMETIALIMAGKALEDDIAEFLTILADRGETVDEITGAARVMRTKALPIKAPENSVDCCGTGGDKSGTYNISTAVALVCAACGVPMAKHGNRAASSKSGAADVLEALGVNLDISPAALEESLKTLHFAFLMAPNHHQAMRHVAPVRKKIGKRTLFNILGPLASPAGAQIQLLGVFDKFWLIPMAQVLHRLGTKRAWIVHGSDGLDEITTTGPTFTAILDENGHITEKTITPADFGLPVSKPQDLLGGSAQENAEALRALLEGEQCAYRDIVLANSAAALCLHENTTNLKESVHRAAKAIDSGDALKILENYILFSKENALP